MFEQVGVGGRSLPPPTVPMHLDLLVPLPGKLLPYRRLAFRQLASGPLRYGGPPPLLARLVLLSESLQLWYRWLRRYRGSIKGCESRCRSAPAGLSLLLLPAKCFPSRVPPPHTHLLVIRPPERLLLLLALLQKTLLSGLVLRNRLCQGLLGPLAFVTSEQ